MRTRQDAFHNRIKVMRLSDPEKYLLPLASVSFLVLLCRMPVPILKHRLELEGISHVVLFISFPVLKAF